ncbi:DUF2530 domain-containing protein [Ornithinimicrobium ciconiae]|uniref:DUF2530 domain-containing protein n=1 Tax=Ornithinimicrobium ciconiae TaxID=2594265 RepID=UPI001D17D5B7|nr:DUF2530 domain-containing protein [Ornithinimicrobium ciconiae]
MSHEAETPGSAKPYLPPHLSEQSPLPPIDPPVVTLRTIRLVRWGIALWALALVVLAFVPSLREGERDWWFWVPVAGIALGAIGHFYLARGRGNAADA